MIRFSNYTVVTSDLNLSKIFFSNIGFLQITESKFVITNRVTLNIREVKEARYNASLYHYLRSFDFDVSDRQIFNEFAREHFALDVGNNNGERIIVDKDSTVYKLRQVDDFSDLNEFQSPPNFKRIHHLCISKSNEYSKSESDYSINRFLSSLENAREDVRDSFGMESHECGCSALMCRLEEYNSINHIAIEVMNQEEVANNLMHHNYQPFQMDHDGHKKAITSVDDLSFGLGSIFVYDPDGNLFEFLQEGKYSYE